MPWWGVLLTVVGTQAVFLLIVWLLVRRKRGDGQELVEAERSKAARLETEVKAEREAREKITAELQRFADESRKVQAWYNEQKDRIAKEAQDAFTSLASDPAALDARLDALLGTARTDPTKPG